MAAAGAAAGAGVFFTIGTDTLLAGAVVETAGAPGTLFGILAGAGITGSGLGAGVAA
jgi:hypothetical protein